MDASPDAASGLRQSLNGRLDQVNMSHTHGAWTMEVKIRYLSHDLARYFGSSEKRETVHLPDNAVYENIRGVLKEKYEKATKELPAGKTKRRTLDFLVFLCEGKPIATMVDKSVDPDSEVLVAYADFGG